MPPPPVEEVMLYCLCTGINPSRFVQVGRKTGPYFIKPRSAETKLEVERVPLPEPLSDLECFHARVPADEQQAFFDRYEVSAASARKLPDVFQCYSHTSFFCSEKAKTIMEAHDPEACQFIPVTLILKSSGEALDLSYYACVPFHYLYDPRGDVPWPKPRADTSFPGSMNHLLERLQSDPVARDLIADWAVWAHPMVANTPFFSPRLFVALRDAGLTGLKEIVQDRKGGHLAPIGHVFF